MKPETRGRTWTASIASKWPENSSQVVMRLAIGWATVTGGGGGGACAAAAPAERHSASEAIAAARGRAQDRVEVAIFISI